MNLFLPNTIIIGAMRSGTTSVFRYLSDHPDVCIGKKKEINAFLLSDNPDVIVAEYAFQFKNAGGQKIRLEASPCYARESHKVLRKINGIIPDAKIIFLLRDPVERVYSIYKAINRSNLLKPNTSFDIFVKSLLADPPNFNIFWNYQDGYSIWVEIHHVGNYSNVIKDILQNIGRKQIFLGFLEALYFDPYVEMQRLCHFLDINPTFYSDYTFIVENPTIFPKNPKLYALALKINLELETILNRIPQIRKLLRSIHHSINSAPNLEMPVKTREVLDIFYQKNRALLLKLLLDLDVDNYPDWLKKTT